MPTFRYETSQGTFEIESNRQLTPEELMNAIPRENVQKQNILGKTFNVPAAANRAAIREQPALGFAGPLAGTIASTGIAGKEAQRATVSGAARPDEVETFQSEALRKHGQKVAKKAGKRTGIFSPRTKLGRALVEYESLKKGFVPSALGLGQDIATNPAEVLLSMIPSAPVGKGQTVGSKIGSSKFGQFVTKEATKERHLLTKGKDLVKLIDEPLNKAIRPTVRGKKTIKNLEKSKESGREAVLSIVDNETALQFVDDAGNVTKGKLPENLTEFNQASEQVKSILFNQYDDLQRRAGQQATVSVDDILTELTTIRKDRALQIKNPETIKYAMELKARFSNAKNLTTQEADDLIKHFNSSLKAYYRNPDPNASTRVVIDSMVANNLRKSLDKTVSDTVGTGFQTLKRQYGAIRAIEEDLGKRLIVDARKNYKGLLDFTDIFTAGKAVEAMTTLSPAKAAQAATWFGVKSYYKMLNNPNYIVKQMFRNVKKAGVTRASAFVRNAEVLGGGAIIPTSNQLAITGQTTPTARMLGFEPPKLLSAPKYNPPGVRTPHVNPLRTPNVASGPSIPLGSPSPKIPVTPDAQNLLTFQPQFGKGFKQGKWFTSRNP